MSPTSFAILTLAALVIVSHLAQLVCELMDANHRVRRSTNRPTSHIA